MPDATPTPATVVTEFVLDRLHTLPLAERIRISRATAHVMPDDKNRRALLQIVVGLERIERQQRKLALMFRERGNA